MLGLPFLVGSLMDYSRWLIGNRKKMRFWKIIGLRFLALLFNFGLFYVICDQQDILVAEPQRHGMH
jgi:hypothetical protein